MDSDDCECDGGHRRSGRVQHCVRAVGQRLLPLFIPGWACMAGGVPRRGHIRLPGAVWTPNAVSVVMKNLRDPVRILAGTSR